MITGRTPADIVADFLDDSAGGRYPALAVALRHRDLLELDPDAFRDRAQRLWSVVKSVAVGSTWGAAGLAPDAFAAAEWAPFWWTGPAGSARRTEEPVLLLALAGLGVVRFFALYGPGAESLGLGVATELRAADPWADG